MDGIGENALNEIFDASHELRAYIREEFAPNEGVCRISDDGEYVSEGDWLTVWAAYPSWWQDAWLLADNGKFSFSMVARMTVDEIMTAARDSSFCPKYAFFMPRSLDGQEPLLARKSRGEPLTHVTKCVLF